MLFSSINKAQRREYKKNCYKYISNIIFSFIIFWGFASAY